MASTDRRIKKTKDCLRKGLAELLEEKGINDITVKELTDRVDINRSTFYLHYRDIYDMMEQIEDELVQKIEEAIHAHPVSPFGENSFSFFEDIFSILASNKEICSALLGENGDISFLHRIEELLSEHSLKVLRDTFPDKMGNLKYAYSFCLSGCVGLIKTWLSGGHEASPHHMAKLTFSLILNAMKTQR